jgi:hypothetical protein
MNLAIFFLFLLSKFSHFWRLKTSEITFVFEVLILKFSFFDEKFRPVKKKTNADADG